MGKSKHFLRLYHIGHEGQFPFHDKLLFNGLFLDIYFWQSRQVDRQASEA